MEELICGHGYTKDEVCCRCYLYAGDEDCDSCPFGFPRCFERIGDCPVWQKDIAGEVFEKLVVNNMINLTPFNLIIGNYKIKGNKQLFCAVKNERILEEVKYWAEKNNVTVIMLEPRKKK